jgi:hypothetical protein
VFFFPIKNGVFGGNANHNSVDDFISSSQMVGMNPSSSMVKFGWLLGWIVWKKQYLA